MRCLEAPALIELGRFTCSLYLTHPPSLQRQSTKLFALVGLTLPLSVRFSYAFHWVFERRFVGSPAAFSASARAEGTT